MICSAARGSDLQIQEQDFDTALSLLLGAEVNMHRTFGGLGKARFSGETNVVQEYLKNIGTTTRKLVLQRFYRDIDAGTLEGIEMSLQRMGVLRIRLDAENADKVYTWIGE